MHSPIQFYFDFTSPYGYLAARRIEAVAERHERSVDWRPVLLGAIFRTTGQQPLTEAPLKGDYALLDFARSAREHQIPYRQPARFPIGTVPAARAVYWLKEHDDTALHEHAAALVHGLYEAYFVQGIDIGQADEVVSVARALGFPHSELQAALDTDNLRQRLRRAVEEAVEAGIFGSPMMIVDGEPFWGNDRILQLDRWLDRGGW